jgi:hypothetical protein
MRDLTVGSVVRRAATRILGGWTFLTALSCGDTRAAAVSEDSVRATHCAVAPDTEKLSSVARDTISRLRARTQRTSHIVQLPTGTDVRTEDTDPTSLHDGGIVGFNCTGKITLVWLDGG